MERFGDFFPENPRTSTSCSRSWPAHGRHAGDAQLDDARAAGAAAGLSEQLLEDMDLRWQMDQLGQNLRQAFPDAGWDRRYDFSGGPARLRRGRRDDERARRPRPARAAPARRGQPGALAEVDLDRARELLGDEAATAWSAWPSWPRCSGGRASSRTSEGRYELTPEGMRRLGQNALADLFRKLDEDQLGRHELERTGIGHERTYHTKPYEFGDPFNLHIERTIRNAVARSGAGRRCAVARRLRDRADRAPSVRSSTVLMLDLSLSMPMRDNFLPAKKVAMALHSLISMQYPATTWASSGSARWPACSSREQLPEVSWDFVYGTNMQHGFQLARSCWPASTAPSRSS
jgi:uncharacterized protein with von Willebrand factor type A (vWA) domain